MILSYSLSSDNAPKVGEQPQLKCAGCGQRYVWHAAAWNPVFTVPPA